MDKSGDTERMSMRGSRMIDKLSAGLVEVDGCEIRLMSSTAVRFRVDWEAKGNSQQSAFVTAPTKAQGARTELLTILMILLTN